MTTNVDRAADVIDVWTKERQELNECVGPPATGHPAPATTSTTTTDQPKTAYLTGPTTGHPDYNFPAFHLAAARLRELGLTILSPAEDDENDPLTPPSHEAAWPHQAYMRRSLRMLLDCDAIVLLPGWDSCTGAQLERQVASACGLDIFEVGKWLLEGDRLVCDLCQADHADA